jgi:hypothetical protein
VDELMQGRDVYEDNGDLSPEWFEQWAFVYIRAFNENGRRDKRFAQNWAASKGHTKRGVYGWPIHGADNSELGRQLASIADDAELMPMADVELGGRPSLPTVAEVEAYVRACSGGFYSNLSEVPRSAYLDARPWWFANPSGNEAPRSVALTQYGIVDDVDADRTDDLTPILLEEDVTEAELLAVVRGEGISGAADRTKNGTDLILAKLDVLIAAVNKLAAAKDG